MTRAALDEVIAQAIARALVRELRAEAVAGCETEEEKEQQAVSRPPAA
jgi:hypothetical protein